MRGRRSKGASSTEGYGSNFEHPPTWHLNPKGWHLNDQHLNGRHNWDSNLNNQNDGT